MRAASGHYCGVVIFHSAQSEKGGLPNSLFLETLLKSESILGVDIFGSYLLPPHIGDCISWLCCIPLASPS